MEKILVGNSNLETELHKNKFFGLVGFYGISTIVGYLMPNPLYTYSKLVNGCLGQPKGSVFNSYYTEV